MAWWQILLLLCGGSVAIFIALMVFAGWSDARSKVSSMKKRKDIKGLIRALDSGDAGRRKEAVAALHEIGNARAVEPLIDKLKDEKSEIRAAAAAALGDFRDTRAVVPLILLLADIYNVVRGSAARALGMLGDERAVQPLIALLNDNAVREPVQAALEMLGKSAQQPLIAVLGHRDSYTRRAAADVLTKLGWAPPTDQDKARLAVAQQDWRQVRTLGAAGVDALGVALDDPLSSVRREAVAVLGSTSDPRAVDLLVARFNDDDEAVRSAAVSALTSLRAIEPLHNALADPRADIRRLAAEALNRLEWQPQTAADKTALAVAHQDWKSAKSLAKKAVDPLIMALGDSDRHIYHDALDVMEQLGTGPAERLIAWVNDAAAPVMARAAAGGALRQMGVISPVEDALNALEQSLLGNLQSNGPLPQRTAAAAALGRLGAPSSVPPLNSMLGKETDVDMIKTLALSLGELGDKRSASVLRGKLDINSSKVRRSVAWAMIQIGDPSASSSLSVCINSYAKSWKVKGYKEVAEARKILDALAKLRGSKDEARKEGVKALAEVDGRLIRKPLRALLDHSDPETRRSALQVLRKHGWKPHFPLDHIRVVAATQDWEPVKALGPAAVEPLISFLRSLDPEQSCGAAEVLGTLGDTRAVLPLLACWKSADETLRTAVGNALIQIGPGAIAPLTAVLDDPDAAARQFAAGILEQLAWEPETDADRVRFAAARQDWAQLKALGGPAVDRLIDLLNDGEPGVQWAAADTLAAIGDTRAIEPLIPLMEHRLAKTREAAFNALAAFGADAVGPMVALLGGDRQSMRTVARDVLVRIGPGTIDALKPLLDHENALTRMSVIEALDALKWQPATEVEQVQAAAARQDWSRLREMGMPAADRLIILLGDRDREIRKNAVTALATLGDPVIAPLQACASNTANPLLRRALAGKLLRRMNAYEPVEPALKALVIAQAIQLQQSDASSTRLEAAEILRALPSPDTIEPMITALAQEENPDVIKVLARSLGEQRAVQAVQPLCSKLAINRRKTREAIAAALIEIGDPRAVPALEKCLRERDRPYKSKAYNSLNHAFATLRQGR